ncbi:MAG TPA: protein UsfY [Mycobacterium sp.]|nr:protein UsfY [Mycobacterium sp.]
MGETSRDPVDHARTTQPRAGESMKDTARIPGLILVAAGVVAFVICLANFALGQIGVGIAAVVVALLAGGAGLAWLAMERRRVREAERQWLINRRGPDR